MSKGHRSQIKKQRNLETNAAIQNQWKAFDSKLHKRRRAFVKKIN